MRGLANHILTTTAATVFVAAMIFAQLLDFTAEVQTRGGDGFTTEPLSSSWWNILIEKNPIDAQFFALLIFSIPILAFVVLSRSIIFKILLSILFLDLAWHTGKVFMSGERLVDRNGCFACDVQFSAIMIASLFCLLALFGLAALRLARGARVGLGE